MKIKEFQKEVHNLARDKGWYSPPKSDLESLMMVVSEVAEAVEHIRSGTESLHYSHGKPDGLAIELADIIIRTLDFAESKGIDMERYLSLKHEFNKTRPFRHGKKV